MPRSAASIWIYTVCQCPINGMLGIMGYNKIIKRKAYVYQNTGEQSIFHFVYYKGGMRREWGARFRKIWKSSGDGHMPVSLFYRALSQRLFYLHLRDCVKQTCAEIKHISPPYKITNQLSKTVDDQFTFSPFLMTTEFDLNIFIQINSTYIHTISTISDGIQKEAKRLIRYESVSQDNINSNQPVTFTRILTCITDVNAICQELM